jgi:hypothetical protein
MYRRYTLRSKAQDYLDERVGVMPITPFLDDQKFDEETTRIMGVAFEMARAAVKRDWSGVYGNRIIAKQIIELVKAGQRDPDILCEQAISHFLRDLAI